MSGRIASGDGNLGSFQLFNFSVPTKESAEKILFIPIECNLNMPSSELNDRTPYEDVVLNKSATNFFNAFPVIKKAPVFNSKYPIWAWYHPKPDLRRSGHLTRDTSGV